METRLISFDSVPAGERLDRFLARSLPEFSRSRLQDLIKSGCVTVDRTAAKSSQVLRGGEAVELSVPPAGEPTPLEAQDIPLDILQEDEFLLVLNKPPGLVTHPGAGNREGTLVNGILHHCGEVPVAGGTDRPGIVHRLDKETSGCMVVAKTEPVQRALSALFASRSVEKTYLALAEGTPRHPHGEIDARIARHPVHRQKMAVSERGREAATKFRVLGSDSGFSLIECKPRTGRTHQIRVHLKHLGHPVAGDPVYGRRGKFPRHLLHAWKLAFKHPAIGKRMEFCAPVPADFPNWARKVAVG
jgi:23S rRNA pseudouridine1911/1915/1917 synthase